MLLSTIGFVVAGALIGGAVLASFWDDIKDWLNNVAADAVEKSFGYEARNHLQKAIVFIDKGITNLKNTSVIYTKRSPFSKSYDKTTVHAEADVEDIDRDILREIEKHDNKVTQTFDYCS